MCEIHTHFDGSHDPSLEAESKTCDACWEHYWKTTQIAEPTEQEVLDSMLKSMERPKCVYLVVEHKILEKIDDVVFIDKNAAEKRIRFKNAQADAKRLLSKVIIKKREEWKINHPFPKVMGATQEKWFEDMNSYLVNYLWLEFKDETDRWELDRKEVATKFAVDEKPTWTIKELKVS